MQCTWIDDGVGGGRLGKRNGGLRHNNVMAAVQVLSTSSALPLLQATSLHRYNQPTKHNLISTAVEISWSTAIVRWYWYEHMQWKTGLTHAALYREGLVLGVKECPSLVFGIVRE